MSTAPDAEVVLATLNASLERLQQSARRTLPMFTLGIFATIIAAGVALYYILTLSADLHDARQKLFQSQAALSDTQVKLVSLNDALRKAQQHTTSPQAAQTIQNAISDVSSSQQSLTAVSSSLTVAASKIATTGQPAPDGTCRLQVNDTVYITGSCEIQISQGGSFQIWTLGRTGPSASVIRQGTYGIGSWQAAPGQAPASLGMLQRNGACWSNENGQICAWK